MSERRDFAPYTFFVEFAQSFAQIAVNLSAVLFAPNEYVRREEMAAMIIRALAVKQGQSAAETSQSTDFEDLGDASPWAVPYINTASELGLLQGRAQGYFAPAGLMTRAEAAQVIANMLK